jgi:nitrous oxidase accessory protein
MKRDPMQKSRNLAVLFTVLLLSTLIFFQPPTVNAQNKTITVPNQYRNIQDAIDNANTGDTVFVKSGNYILTGYPDGLTINKSISLIGENRGNTILTQHLYRGSEAGIKALADDITITGFTITGSFIDIEVSGSNCKIINNNIANSIISGLRISGANHTISRNTFNNNDCFGLYNMASNTVISNNSLSGNKFAGMITDSCENVTISQNKIFSNGNKESQNSTGGLILRWTGPFYVKGNTINNNVGFGIELGEDCNNADITNNEISSNNFGFYLYNYILNPSGTKTAGKNNQVIWNNINNNNVAVFVGECIFTVNKANGDTGHSSDIVAWDNGVVGNHWSDYNGYGVYLIDQNNKDNHPLTQTVNTTLPVPTQNSAPLPYNLAFTPIFMVIIIVIVGIVILFVFLVRKTRSQ